MIGFLFAALLAVLLAPGAARAQDNTTCDANAYALCSHALCACLDADGAPTDCPEDPAAAGTVTWASCACPVVKVGPEPAYNANIGDTACLQRSATTLPDFATPLGGSGQVQLIFSQYSLGDAAPGARYGTLDGARMQLCPPTDAAGKRALYANCLDQPCFWDGVSAEASCFCPVNPATGTWNTFASDCGAGLCETPPGKVWSAADAGATAEATGRLQGFIAATGRTPPEVGFCPPG
ncbi:hypothetical protein P2H44_13765 [Albimonas sp. CAU 1670]|uniref:hypothetical protein n=1 Tax=Albimonas sp. CAU 1670 TaxID=3032599 RepID=UPI0023DAE7D6|nr:hypothetical protein [Albimonas sp. CAU 1670]MDF2233622.1 hypothetical protein [Albimonas sp. CAU 1670]